TVLGRDHFIASGHPDLRDKQPSRLGLIESRDGGKSWTPRSLSGKSDLHDLAASQGTVYAVDSSTGSLMVTRDLKRWESRSQADLRDVTVAPDDPTRLVALSGQQTLRSTDGARTFTPVAAAPPLVLVDWGKPGLFGITADGALWSSPDGGGAWTQQGSAGGEPVAMVVTADEVIVALADARIVSSSDGGATWRERYKPTAG
ncbi:MAG: exo-alpha-sialidase, partial [Mycobacteriales bacterium]